VLVLVSFGLVLLATVLLVVGLLTDDAMTLIYLSIACSATAAVVLWVAFRKARPKQESASEPPTPILPEGVDPETEASAVAAAPAPSAAVTAGAEDRDRTTVQPVVAGPEAEAAAEVNPGGTPTAATEAAVGTATPDDDWVDDDDWADAGEFEVEFPIADYDDLSVAEIMPLLPQLYSDELEVVAERERSTKNRTTILKRLDELAATGTDADAMDADDELEVEPQPAAPAEAEPAPVAARSLRSMGEVPSLSDDDWDDDEVVFPIADYDELTADQIIPLLPHLEADELEDVKAREVAGQGRKSVITEIDRHLGLTDGDDAWQADDHEPPGEVPAAGSVLAISGYDGLTVAEIRPLLSGLSAAELRAVLDHEVARDNRRTIVSEIERRLEDVDREAAPTPAARPARKTAAKKATKRAAATKATRTKKAAGKKAAGKNAAAKKAASTRFPIADYDSLAVAQIRPRLSSLSPAELRRVREREVSGAGRKTILADIDRRLG